jgi:hypothetical protein
LHLLHHGGSPLHHEVHAGRAAHAHQGPWTTHCCHSLLLLLLLLLLLCGARGLGTKASRGAEAGGGAEARRRPRTPVRGDKACCGCRVRDPAGLPLPAARRSARWREPPPPPPPPPPLLAAAPPSSPPASPASPEGLPRDTHSTSLLHARVVGGPRRYHDGDEFFSRSQAHGQGAPDRFKQCQQESRRAVPASPGKLPVSHSRSPLLRSCGAQHSRSGAAAVPSCPVLASGGGLNVLEAQPHKRVYSKTHMDIDRQVAAG